MTAAASVTSSKAVNPIGLEVYTLVHNMFHTVSLGRIDQCFALHEHVNCISSYKKESRDVFQCLIERSWIIEIDKARCPKLICEIFQIRFSSRPYRKVCVTPS